MSIALDKKNINQLSDKISKDICTAVKITCTRNKEQNNKLTKETKELIKRRRKLDRNTTEYKNLNKIIKKEIRNDTRNYNTKIIKQNIEQNKSTKNYTEQRINLT